jgi:hypothetical protein
MGEKNQQRLIYSAAGNVAARRDNSANGQGCPRVSLKPFIQIHERYTQ